MHTKQRIITCIPKEGKNKFQLSNWRPISLLYVIFKIGSGCLARNGFRHCFLGVYPGYFNFFQFGPYICRCVKTFQKNAVSCVSQAGILSNFFKLERGCRHGDQISPYIFFFYLQKYLHLKLKKTIQISKE